LFAGVENCKLDAAGTHGALAVERARLEEKRPDRRAAVDSWTVSFARAERLRRPGRARSATRNPHRRAMARPMLYTSSFDKATGRSDGSRALIQVKRSKFSVPEPVMAYVVAFLASVLVVVLAGTALARYADAIADAGKLGRVWIGSVLLAGATSLPELITDIAAVKMGAPDLAVGDLMGSGLANMLILAVIDLVAPRQEVLKNVAFDHIVSASLAISLTAIAAILIVSRPATTMLWVAPGSVALFFAYVTGTRAVYRHATRDGAGTTGEAGKRDPDSPSSLRRAVLGFGVAALVVFAAAPILAWSAQGIAVSSGLGNTFVGTWLVGLATSLPELVASLAAVKMRAFDLAVGNLFGSNAFNMAILLPLDLAQPGSLFAAVDPSHAISGLAGVILMSLGVAAIAYRAKRRFALLEPGSVLVLLGYVAALVLLYQHSVAR
jgi:cation:H+ antiporter